MSQKREYLDYLADIQEATDSILAFTEGMTWEQFSQDRKTLYAVIRAFEIVGEAATKVPMPVPQAAHQGALEADGRHARQTDP